MCRANVCLVWGHAGQGLARWLPLTVEPAPGANWRGMDSPLFYFLTGPALFRVIPLRNTLVAPIFQSRFFLCPLLSLNIFPLFFYVQLGWFCFFSLHLIWQFRPLVRRRPLSFLLHLSAPDPTHPFYWLGAWGQERTGVKDARRKGAAPVAKSTT